MKKSLFEVASPGLNKIKNFVFIDVSSSLIMIAISRPFTMIFILVVLMDMQ